MPCAFCGQASHLSREHIWPKWLHDSGDYPLKYHSKPDKVLPAEHVIRDVCKKCNNGPLSELDDYMKSLHLRYFSRDYHSVKNVIFEYDFERLTKWLLKVSYNSARAAGATDVDLLRLYAPYIITPGCSPAFAAFTVSLMGQLIVVDKGTGAIKALELNWCRCGPIALSEAEAAIMTVRVIMIHGWCFTLIIMNDAELKAGDEDLVMPRIQGAVIRPDRVRTRVPTVSFDPGGLLKHYRDKRKLYTTSD